MVDEAVQSVLRRGLPCERMPGPTTERPGAWGRTDSSPSDRASSPRPSEEALAEATPQAPDYYGVSVGDSK